MKFFIKDFSVNVTKSRISENILNAKFHFLCSECYLVECHYLFDSVLHQYYTTKEYYFV